MITFHLKSRLTNNTWVGQINFKCVYWKQDRWFFISEGHWRLTMCKRAHVENIQTHLPSPLWASGGNPMPVKSKNHKSDRKNLHVGATSVSPELPIPPALYSQQRFLCACVCVCFNSCSYLCLPVPVRRISLLAVSWCAQSSSTTSSTHFPETSTCFRGFHFSKWLFNEMVLSET